MIPDDATLRQIEAADPKRSTWLSANAGSGKTRVLTDRVARLLLDGTRPENVLCLTYTKAAASEMQNRLFKRLGAWAMMPSAELRAQLIEMGANPDVDGIDLAKARRLFAAAIETPGGLKIQTIHSFCAGVLRRFPLEAEVSPQFKEMEDRAAQLLREDVLDDMARGPHANVVAAFAQYYTGGEVANFLAAITGSRSGFITAHDDDRLTGFFGLPETLTRDGLIAAIAGPDDLELLKRLIPVCLASGANDQKAAAKLMRIDCDAPVDLAALAIMEDVFLFGDSAARPFGAKIDAFPVKSVRAAHPELIEELNDLMQRVEEGRDTRLSWLALEKTRALLAFATPFLEAYEARKMQRAALDFDDLIRKAKALLQDPAVAQWVLFRLDGGVDHVLVDEAQDTSPDQWDIVRLLTQEFSTGEGARPERPRTVFVVGDKKQSIYSFQGADPEGFDRMRTHFKGELAKVDKPLQDSELLYSFRASEAILRLVDQTFSGAMTEGLGDRVAHLAFKTDMPGRVDLWPVIEPSTGDDDREWDDPLDQKGRTSHEVLLALQIAQSIKRMIQTETIPVKKDGIWVRRAITAGDFLILVQRRSDLFGEIIAACKSAGLDIAGADRLKLGGELAVKDISAVMQFLSLQDDDLSLAAALRSPLLGWSEKQLYDLAHPRKKGQSLWQALRTSGAHEDTLAILRDLRNNSDFLRPYDLINRLLIRHDGRKNLIARLGHEAEDGIDALLSQALGYEQSAVPSLTGFLSWLQTEDVTVKRQMDSAGDRIRVMTVHGAKGLEAPIVILPDTVKRDRKGAGEIMQHAGTAIWKPNKPQMPRVLQALNEDAIEANERERRRLLYVAMTRAENWLIVAAAGKVGADQDSWYSTIAGAMDALDCVKIDASFGTIKRFSRWNWDDGPLITPQGGPIAHAPRPTFGDTLPDLPVQPAPRAPSDLGGAKIMAGETHTDASDLALAWGRIVHVLLEILPGTDPQDRPELARDLVQNHPDAGLIANPADVIDEALRLLETPDLDWIFADGLAEIPISATLDALGGTRIYGIIDRLIVSETEIIAVDFKSNRITPNTPQDTPDGVIRQMAAYRDALRQIYPTRKVRAIILWTRTGEMTELDDTILTAALNRVLPP